MRLVNGVLQSIEVQVIPTRNLHEVFQLLFNRFPQCGQAILDLRRQLGVELVQVPEDPRRFEHYSTNRKLDELTLLGYNCALVSYVCTSCLLVSR